MPVKVAFFQEKVLIALAALSVILPSLVKQVGVVAIPVTLAAGELGTVTVTVFLQPVVANVVVTL